jgi:signal recognition particle receptor subunit beta
MWNELARGAVGAVVLVDTRRLASSFPAIDFFERRHIPFVVAINAFYGDNPYSSEEVRSALKLSDTVPIVLCDARERESAKLALIQLVRHAMSRLPQPIA